MDSLNQQSIQEPVVSQPIQQQISKTEQHLSIKKTLLILMGIFILLGVIGGVYYIRVKNDRVLHPQKKTNSILYATPSVTVTNVPLPTSSYAWENYINTKEGYSFSYPSNVKYKPMDASDSGNGNPVTFSLQDGTDIEILYLGYAENGFPALDAVKNGNEGTISTVQGETITKYTSDPVNGFPTYFFSINTFPNSKNNSTNSPYYQAVFSIHNTNNSDPNTYWEFTLICGNSKACIDSNLAIFEKIGKSFQVQR